MKKILASLLFVLMFAAFATAQTPAQPSLEKQEVKKVGGPIMTFEQTTIDYGTIQQGADGLRKFKFKNTGTEPLVINNARGSCGCTVPSFKHEPIAPGETGEIEVKYDTQRVGPISKTVTVETNEGQQARILTISGTVIEKKVEEGVPANAPSLISAPKQ
jgi:hypothetical protein